MKAARRMRHLIRPGALARVSDAAPYPPRRACARFWRRVSCPRRGNPHVPGGAGGAFHRADPRPGGGRGADRRDAARGRQPSGRSRHGARRQPLCHRGGSRSRHEGASRRRDHRTVRASGGLDPRRHRDGAGRPPLRHGVHGEEDRRSDHRRRGRALPAGHDHRQPARDHRGPRRQHLARGELARHGRASPAERRQLPGVRDERAAARHSPPGRTETSGSPMGRAMGSAA
jgi:hypothetical protein